MGFAYTIQEGQNDLFLINNRNGKKYKFNLTDCLMPIYVGGRKISGGASSDPSSGLSEGDVYYKTDTDKLRFYNGKMLG